MRFEKMGVGIKATNRCNPNLRVVELSGCRFGKLHVEIDGRFRVMLICS
jgi:hypothetical protein